jgi:hypothetical protein
MQIQQRQHLGHLRRLACPRRQDRRRKPLPLTGIRVDTFVIDPRRLYRHRTRGGQHVTPLVITVAHHKPSAVVVDMINELFHIRCDLGLQRRLQHPPSAVADNLIQQRPTRTSIVVGRIRIMNYREHGRTFPNQRANAGP